MLNLHVTLKLEINFLRSICDLKCFQHSDFCSEWYATLFIL